MKTPGFDTNELIRAAAAGNDMARANLLQRHRARLTRMVGLRMDRRTRARFDPSDVVQEAMLIAGERLSEYLRNEPIPFYPWLRRITWEQLLKFHERHIATQKRSVRREEDGPPRLNDESRCELVDRLASSLSNPSAGMIRQEMSERIHDALVRLKEKDREVIELLYLEQLEPKDVAEILGVSQPTVWTRHMRAIRRLTSVLEDR